MIIIDGKKAAKKIENTLREELKEIPFKPSLHTILLGEDPASIKYVNMKKKACESLGMTSEIHQLPYNTSETKLIYLINSLNENKKVNGILVQLPLPNQIDNKIIDMIDTYKDVDGLNQTNTAKLYKWTKNTNNNQTEMEIKPFRNIIPGSKITRIINPLDEFILEPCTPRGIIDLLDYYNINTTSKNVTIIGRSNIVGKPLATMLSNNQYNTTATQKPTT